MTDSNDEFSGVFDDLSPDDFIRDTSARHVTVVERQPFGEFVDASLDALRYGFHCADGQPNPVAILISDDGRRMFTPDDDESLGQYCDRLTREARKHQAHTLFTAWLTTGGAFEDDSEQEDVSSPDMMERAKEAGVVRPCLYWFAQHKSKVRHGIMEITDAGDTGDVIEAQPEHAAPVYLAILGT